MEPTILPQPKDLRDMLEGLLGRDVTLAPSAPVEPDKPISVGIFVNDSLGTEAVAVADFPFTAYAAAAIGLVPKGGADAALEDRELPQSLKDNMYEVLNVVSALFNLPDHPHLKLYGYYPPGEAAPTDIAAIVRQPARRLDHQVEVAGYGKGFFSLVLA